MKKKHPSQSSSKEIRVLPGSISVEVETRAADDGAETTVEKIRGYAAKFNVLSENLGDEDFQFREIISPGAFDGVLNDDVRALWNHDPSKPLARSKEGKGTLKIAVDDVGLRYEFEPPATQAGRDLVESIRRGDVDQSSFGFIVAKDGQEWEERKEGEGPTILKRTITKIARLLDVSPVTFPAYPDATVALRNFENFQKESRSEEDPPDQGDPPQNEPPAEDHSINHWQRKIDLLDKSAES